MKVFSPLSQIRFSNVGVTICCFILEKKKNNGGRRPLLSPPKPPEVTIPPIKVKLQNSKR